MSSNKRYLLFLLVGLFFLILIGCNGNSDSDQNSSQNDDKTEGAKGGELKIAYSAQPPTLDPHMTISIATSDIVKPIYETLVTIDSSNNFQPMLAKSYEMSEDGTKITFYLREDVKFHNGKEMTATDVVASMERWVEKSSTAQAQLSESEFKAEDKYTVSLTLASPLATTFSVLSGMLGSFAAIMPEEIIKNATETGVEEYIGTGPFKFDEWKQDEYIHLSKFADYQPREEVADGLSGKKEALVDDLHFQFITDPSTRVAGILSGEFDIIHAVPFNNADQLSQEDNVTNHIVPGGTHVLILNKKEGIFKDFKAREAINTAIDADAMMKAAFVDEKYYTLNHNMMMPDFEEQFYSEYGKEIYNQNNPEKAKQILEEAGYIGEEITIITTRDYEDQYNSSVVLQERLEQIGLKVNLEVYDWPTLMDKKENPEAYDINIMGLGQQPEPTSYNFIQKGLASGWTDSKDFDDLLKEFRSQASLEDTKDAYDGIMKWNMENMPFIKIGDYNRVVSTRDNVNNFQFLDGLILWNVSLSKN